MPDHPNAPETRTVDVDVHSLDARGRTVHGYAAVYGVTSEDLGGFRERIAPGAFASVLDADVRCLLNHDPNVVLGRTASGTMRLSDDARGLRFEVDLPESRSDLREAVGRGDIDGASFRFGVGEESWDGDLRTVRTVKELRDVTLATYPAYPAASIELRTRPEADSENNNGAERQKEGNVPENENGAAEQRSAEENTENTEAATATEERTENRSGGLQVEDRTSGNRGSLAEEFRSRGFPGETASIEFGEFRTATWTGSVDALNPVRAVSAPLGADQRYAWPVFTSVPVDAGETSVDVPSQTARVLPDAADIVRDIDAVTAKPEVGSTLALVSTPLHQVAGVETGIPNVYLELDAFNSVIETDLRLAVNEGLDKLVLDAIAASGFQAPGTDALLVSIRKAITTIQGNGYAPNVLLLDPASSETLDTLVAEAATEFYVFGPAQGKPGTIFGLTPRVSKTVPAPVVADSTALGKLYSSPITLARFEENAGSTNTSTVRLEGHATFGAERSEAAVRIAAA